MPYVVIKNNHKKGCYALKVNHGRDIVKFKNALEIVVTPNTQVLLISRPEAYGEYAPYNIVNTKEKLLSIAKEI